MFDTEKSYRNLLPLSYTRPVGAFRVGIDTLAEKWAALLPGEYSWLTRPYLQEMFPIDIDPEEDALFVAGNLIADSALAAKAAALEPGHGLCDAYGLWAWRGKLIDFLTLTDHHDGDTDADDESIIGDERVSEADTDGRRIIYVFDIFQKNGDILREDYSRICAGKKSQPVDGTVRVIGPATLPDGTPSLMIEPGARLCCCTLNVTDGPIYIGRDVEIMEGAKLRGPVAVGEKTRIRMDAKIYADTTFGPECRIGGEIDNTVIFGHSNKAHDGYLGNAVIGEWCNLGAGCNASNLKNDYSKIRIWNYAERRFMRTDLQFCGLIMGDHSKAGINTMFNTATVIGVGVNLHGAGFPRPFVPSFSNGSPEGGFSDVSVDSFFKLAAKVMARRGVEWTDVDRRMFEHIYGAASMFKR